MTDTSFLDPSEIAELRQLVRDGLRTELDFGNPEIRITLDRWDETAQDWLPVGGGAEYHVIVRYSDAQPAATGGVAGTSQGQVIRGEVEAFAPFPVEINDRFSLNGVPASITAPPPREEFGIIYASWQMETGTT